MLGFFTVINCLLHQSFGLPMEMTNSNAKQKTVVLFETVISLLKLVSRPPVCSGEDVFKNCQVMMTNWFMESRQWSRNERGFLFVCFFNLNTNPRSQSYPIFVSPSSCGYTDSSRWFEILFPGPLRPEASLFFNIFLSSVYFRPVL